jgi:ADP-heptose:LPS heptosyltransferase
VTAPAPHSPGLYLALHRVAKDVLSVEAPDRVPQELQGKSAIFVGLALLAAPNWRDLAAHYRDCADVSVFFVPDCRHTALPGARIDRDSLLAALRAPGYELLEDDLINGHIFLVLRHNPASPGEFVERPWRKKPKHCLVLRGGAIGDAIMASTVLPALRAQGYAITVCTTAAGGEALRHDPHVDEFIVHRSGQVRDSDIGPLWSALSARFDRTVNLNYAVEHTLLKRPWDGAFYWPDDHRRRECAGSYLQRHHDLAGIPGPFRVAFYPSAPEKAAAEKHAARLGRFALWALRGSGIHKHWNGNAELAVRLLANTDLKLVLTGDDAALADEAVVLDAAARYLGPEAQRRVFSMVNTGSVRRVMALAPYAAVVIGPETGVLNAVCLDPVPKVCFLSHSAPSNLTDDWVNAVPLIPSAPCHPCHRLFQGEGAARYCPRDATGAVALCQSTITPEAAFDAVRRALALPTAVAAEAA